MSEQNKNKAKQKRRKDACKLPEGIDELPKYIQYRKENNVSSREFFIVSHPKLNKIYVPRFMFCWGTPFKF
jgi:hypothetical protein